MSFSRAEYQRKWQKKNKHRTKIYGRRNKLKSKYGMTLEQYDELLAKQGGVCALCQQKPTGKRPLDVDHDHITGRIRGLLCITCNGVFLGRIEKYPGLFTRLFIYLGISPEGSV